MAERIRIQIRKNDQVKVIAGKDLNRNVKQTASKISAEIVQRTKLSPGIQQAGL